MSVGHYENFPVASLLLPRRWRRPVELIYRFARSADDIADEGNDPHDVRLSQLTVYRAELARNARGQPPQAPPFRDLARTVRAYLPPLRLCSAPADAVT